jgi:hypothetical protein
VGAADIEMVADQALEEGPPGLGPIEDAGVRNFELAERKLIDIAVAQVGASERRGEAVAPSPEEAVHCP